MRLTRLLLLSLLLAVYPAAFAQDDAEPDESEPEAEAFPVEQDDEDDEVFDTDDEAYIDIDEEDFIPTEEIVTDQSIPFPTDI